MRPTAWVFDVDGSIIDALSGNVLRPRTRDVFLALRGRGHDIVLWSAGGDDYARRKARQHGLDDLVAAYHDKSERDADGCWIADAILQVYDVEAFVDDLPHELPRRLPSGSRVVAVRPFIGGSPHDRGLRDALGPLGIHIPEG